jgi:hypothetical protein
MLFFLVGQYVNFLQTVAHVRDSLESCQDSGIRFFPVRAGHASSLPDKHKGNAENIEKKWLLRYVPVKDQEDEGHWKDQQAAKPPPDASFERCDQRSDRSNDKKCKA